MLRIDIFVPTFKVKLDPNQEKMKPSGGDFF